MNYRRNRLSYIPRRLILLRKYREEKMRKGEHLVPGYNTRAEYDSQECWCNFFHRKICVRNSPYPVQNGTATATTSVRSGENSLCSEVVAVAKVMTYRGYSPRGRYDGGR